jgi:hypothetical protein
MRRLSMFLLTSCLCASVFSADDACCGAKGGIQYCDSSAGHYVCRNGDYSTCYCTRHATMELQKIAGCCLWQGGVFKVDRRDNLIICNNGGVSEICTYEAMNSPSLLAGVK